MGEEQLLRKLRTRNGAKYDCVIGISGGKDSCYVAYLAVKRYKLRALAVFYDSPFYCDLARKNVTNVCNALNMDLIIIKSKNNFEYKLLRSHILSVAATGTSWGQCIFCHYGIDAILYNVAQEKSIPYMLSGTTQYERWTLGKRTEFLINRVKNLAMRDFYTFVRHQMKCYLLLVSQRMKYKVPCNSVFNAYRGMKSPSKGPVNIKLFDYVQWKHDTIEKTLSEKTGWIKPRHNLSWGYDCSLESLLDFTYKKEFGISTVGIYLSNLIRDGLISRDEAFQILVAREDEKELRTKVDSVLDFLEIPRLVRKKFYSVQ